MVAVFPTPQRRRECSVSQKCRHLHRQQHEAERHAFQTVLHHRVVPRRQLLPSPGRGCSIRARGRHQCTAQSLPRSNPEWTLPHAPLRIAGNLHYVGGKDLASYLIVTPAGNILINSSLEQSSPMICKSFEDLGLPVCAHQNPAHRPRLPVDVCSQAYKRDSFRYQFAHELEPACTSCLSRSINCELVSLRNRKPVTPR
jgi:hypothetical protein